MAVNMTMMILIIIEKLTTHQIEALLSDDNIELNRKGLYTKKNDIDLTFLYIGIIFHH